MMEHSSFKMKKKLLNILILHIFFMIELRNSWFDLYLIEGKRIEATYCHRLERMRQSFAQYNFLANIDLPTVETVKRVLE
jgi:hypothetical protein